MPTEEQEDQLLVDPSQSDLFNLQLSMFQWRNKRIRYCNDLSQQMMLYIGNMKGIQGHQNSCYLDSTIFGLFALSDIFDTMFLEPNQTITSDQNRKAVSELLWKGIVNPLRK